MMLRERYAAMDVFEFVPALSATVDPVLTKLDHLLDDDQLFQLVKADLTQRFPQTASNGRPSTPVEVILRMLVVKHLYGWSYAQTEQWVSDSLVLRQFCRLYFEQVPDDTTLIRWANLIKPQTLHTFLDRVVALAQALKVTRGRKLRMDGTVVETNIHYPTDSGLLADGIRVISRGLGRAKALLSQTRQVALTLFRDRTRSAKASLKQIMEATRSRLKKAAVASGGEEPSLTQPKNEKKEQMRAAYVKLLGTAQAILKQTQQVLTLLKEESNSAATKLVRTLQSYRQSLNQVIEQTRRRVLLGETVNANEKILSLFEPHTALIRKGKLRQPTEFGRAVFLSEVEGGIVTGYSVLEGNPSEAAQLRPSVEHHRQLFNKPPQLLTADRGVFSQEGEDYAYREGVRRVAIPKPGQRTLSRRAREREGWFVRGRNWRAGIEGRISVLKRAHKLARCLYRGEAGMERWVGWGIISHDLAQIAKALAA